MKNENKPMTTADAVAFLGSLADDENAALKAEVERLKWLISQTLQMLPRRRDWLDPDIEREMKAALAPSDPQPAPKFIAWTPRGVLLTGDSINHLYELWGDRTWPEDVEFRSADGTDPQPAKEKE